MAKNTSVSLSEHFQKFIDEQVASGRYGSTSEVVREGLRLLEDRQSRDQRLIDALVLGEKSGVAKDFDFDRYVASKSKG